MLISILFLFASIFNSVCVTITLYVAFFRDGDYIMKKKILMFLFAICFIFPSLIMLTACDNSVGDPSQAILLGFEVYIKGVNTPEFECAEDVSVKSVWTHAKRNATVPLSDFDISVKWIDEYDTKTTLPDFWTNGTGSTANDYATTYEFTLTYKNDNALYASFNVVIKPKAVTNCRVRIFNGEEYTYNAEMIWGHNERETDPEKQYTFNVENLDSGYDLHEHMQWAIIDKDVYDSLATEEDKKEFISGSQAFSTSQIDSHFTPGTYYIFAYVPEWNNNVYGEYGDGKIYSYATLTILPIEIEQQKNENRVLQHTYNHSLEQDFKYDAIDVVSELKLAVDYDEYYSNLWANYYVFENGNWKVLDRYEEVGPNEKKERSIQVHAVNTADGYKLVDLKNMESSLTEWVFINDDGTNGADITDNSLIEVIDYKELSTYKNGSSVKIPVYYMAVSESMSAYLDCSKLFRTEVKIKKHVINLVPSIDVEHGGANTDEYVTGFNTFEFTYGETNSEKVMQNALSNGTGGFYFDGFDKTEASDQPYYGYLRLESPHYAWKLDGVHNSSEPVVITYYIHPVQN